MEVGSDTTKTPVGRTKPAPPPKPCFRPGQTSGKPALPKHFPVARVKPMQHGPPATPNAQVAVSTSPAKAPPPLPRTPPKGLPSKLSPKPSAKSTPTTPDSPSRSTNGIEDDEKERSGSTESTGSENDLKLPGAASPRRSPSPAKKAHGKSVSTGSEKAKKRGSTFYCDTEDSVPETATTEKADESTAIKPSRAAPPPPARPLAPPARSPPKPVPRKRSTTSTNDELLPQDSSEEPQARRTSPIRPIPTQRSIDETPRNRSKSPSPEVNNKAEEARTPPGRSPVPKQRSFDKTPTILPTKSIRSKSPSPEVVLPSSPVRSGSASPTKSSTATDFSAKLAGLLVQGPKKIERQKKVDLEQDDAENAVAEAENAVTEAEKHDAPKEVPPADEVKPEPTCTRQDSSPLLMVPPRKTKKKKGPRDSSPGTIAQSESAEGLGKKEKSEENKLDQNANSVNLKSDDSKPSVAKTNKTDSAQKQTESSSNVQVKKLAMGFGNAFTKGLQQQLSLKTRPGLPPKPKSFDRGMSKQESIDEKVEPKKAQSVDSPLVKQDSVPVNMPEKASEKSSETEVEKSVELGKVDGTETIKSELRDEAENENKIAPALSPRLKEVSTEKKDSRSSSGASISSNSSQGDADVEPRAEAEPPPPLPVRRPRSDVTSPEPGVCTSPTFSKMMKKNEKRPLPPLPSPEEEVQPAPNTSKVKGPRPKNRPLPPLPEPEVDCLSPRPVRPAPGPPNGRQRSLSTPGPLNFSFAEFRPISENIDVTRRAWTDEDEKKYLAMREMAARTKSKEPAMRGSRSSLREGKPVFNAPPPPPVESLDTAENSSQTPLAEDVKFQFNVPHDIEEEEEDIPEDPGRTGSSSSEGVEVSSSLDIGQKRPARPAPPPPPPKPDKPEETVEHGPCDEQGYLEPRHRESSSDAITEYSYVSSEYYPEEELESKDRSESSASSSHIYEFVDTSGKIDRPQSVSVSEDNTYEMPEEVIRRQGSTTSDMYQEMDAPLAPPRPKRNTLRQRSVDILSIVPIEADKPKDDNNEDDEYIYPGARPPNSQDNDFDLTYVIADKPVSSDKLDNSNVDGANVDVSDDYILPQLGDFDSTYDIPSNLTSLTMRENVTRRSSGGQRHSIASSQSSESHDYFDMSSASNLRHTFHEAFSTSLNNRLSIGMLPPMTLSEEQLWKESEGQSDSSDSGSDETEDDDGEQPKKSKLYYIAREIMTSERVFVDVLQLLNLDFRRVVSKTTEEVGRPIIPSATLNQILHYLPQLEKFNSELLEDLTKRLENWDENPRIADIFVRKGPFLRLYISYIKEFDQMMALYDDALRKYPVFAELVRDFETSDRCACLALRHYMLKPIQRIPQYKLLIQDYLNHLPDQSADYKETITALEIVSEIAQHANESMREGDNFQKLLEIQNNLQGNFEVVKPGRTLIKMGILQKLSRREAQPRMLFLFNDVLLYTTPIANKEYKLNHVLSLTGMKALKPSLEEFQNEFNVISIQRSFTVSANSPQERDEWLGALTKAIDENAVKRSTFEVAKTNPEGLVIVDKNFQLGLQAPVWVPDARVTMCMLCTSEFTVTWRRHHCRACGRVVCGACSDFKAPLVYKKNKPERVCGECFEKLDKDHITEIPEEQDSPMSGADSEEGEKRRPRRASDNFKRSTKWVNRLQIKRPSVLKEVQANDQGSAMSGYMKELKGKKWKKRWFVVKDKVLYKYKASEDSAASRSTPLLGYQIKTFTEYFENVEPSLVFQVSHKGTDPITFRTESSAAKERWISAIEDATVA